MDRGLKDEGFVSRAFGAVNFDDAYTFAKSNARQGFFTSGGNNAPLAEGAKAGVIVACQIYQDKGLLTEQDVQKATTLITQKEFRDFIDEHHDKT